MEIVELKSIKSKIKYSLDGLSSTIQMTENRISIIEDR